MKVFPCNKCGLCCQNVHLAIETQSLDRGDGTCRHYDDKNKNCTIYDTRPDICRVEKQYNMHYKDLYEWDEFIVINLEVCDHLVKNLSIK